MKKQLTLLTILFLFALKSFSQGRQVHGIVADSTGITIPGVVVKLKAGVDSSIVTTDINGVFTFNTVAAKQFSLTFLSIGFQGLKKNYTFDNASVPANLGMIKMRAESKLLNVVQITDVNAIKIKEDTTVYSAAAYPVRANASAEDMIKKFPGVDVDANGNVTAEGKPVTKVRINGKDFFGGDVQTATKNLPADVIESIQMIDDYGDQANLTGIKSGESTKVMNIVIRKDKNYGYSLSGTAGAGRDAVPAPATNATRYTFSTNSFTFNGDQQIALLGNINNNNTNTFNFGGFGGGGGGGRGNASRGGGGGQGGGSTTASTANGITDAKSVGLNYRDQWGTTLSVYGSYSFTDNKTFINSTTNQQNFGNIITTNNQATNSNNGTLNHRVQWNMEWKPDTLNYLKITPSFSYGSTNTDEYDSNNFSGPPAYAYTTSLFGNSDSQSYGVNVLYNHRFNGHGRNFSIQANASTTPNYVFQNPINTYQQLVGLPPAGGQDQYVTTDSRTNSWNTTVSYIEPLSKVSFLEGSYSYNYSKTNNNKEIDTVAYAAVNLQHVPFTLFNNQGLSNTYNYSFITNRFALNYRFIKEKYNFTLGLGVQPAELQGYSPATTTQAAVTTDNTTVKFSPTARYVYNFSRSQALTFNYNGASNQPTYAELNPRLDQSNTAYQVQGNPNLQPEFANNFSLRYNKFSIGTGNIFFSNLTFTQTNDHIIQNTTQYPNNYRPNPSLSKAIVTSYTNENGYYSGSGFLTYAKPWDKRKYTLILNGNISYANNISYVSTVDSVSATSYATTTNRNVAKTLTFTPGVRFRLDITDVIDAQASASYGVTTSNNSYSKAPNTDVRTTLLGLNGKNYLWTNWTVSYDYSKAIYTGYTVPITNPNILTTYLERRFLKNNAATIRATVYDVFNQNTGYSVTSNGSQTSQTNINRLGRYYLLTFTLRLQKFAGKAPQQDFGPGAGGRRNGEGGARGPSGGGNGGGGFGGPGGE